MGLGYCVITSVNRDDLPDGGAFLFAACIRKVHEKVPACRVEVLIPDFGGSWPALEKVIDARPEVLNHNIETARRVFHRVRPKGDYQLSLDLLAEAKRIDPQRGNQVGHNRRDGRNHRGVACYYGGSETG